MRGEGRSVATRAGKYRGGLQQENEKLKEGMLQQERGGGVATKNWIN
jgi:hypothetical protein